MRAFFVRDVGGGQTVGPHALCRHQQAGARPHPLPCDAMIREPLSAPALAGFFSLLARAGTLAAI